MCMYIHIYRKCLEVAHDLNNYAILIILSNSLNSFNYGQATGIACIYTRKPPLSPTNLFTVSEYIEEGYWLAC